MVTIKVVAFAPKVNEGLGPSEAANFCGPCNSRLSKYFTGKIGQSKISDLCKEIKFSKNFDMHFQICTVVLRSPISALQEGMVENVKFNRDFAKIFGMFLLKYYTVHSRFPCSEDKKVGNSKFFLSFFTLFFYISRYTLQT